MVQLKCVQCGKLFKVIPARAESAKLCSRACAAEWRKTAFRGAGNPKWMGGPREKVCQHCKKVFQWKGEPLSSFLKRKFCSKECIVAGQKRLHGAEHPRYREDARRRMRTGQQYWKWQTAVLSRDKATCQMCGAKETELHAHHIKSWREHPELRFNVSNGLTVCAKCHWLIHSAGNENPVNSVKPLTDGAEGNTEPSFDRKIIEGVTTRGRTYRRVETSCEWCGAFVSQSLGHFKQHKHHFCSTHCAGKYSASNRYGDNPSTSAGRESEEIV